ncbi:MAG: four helix bundle protein, partial [Vicinamibacterales bacterium]
RGEKARFYNIAEASLDEASYFLKLAADLRYGHDPTLDESAAEIGRMLATYCQRLRHDTRDPSSF